MKTTIVTEDAPQTSPTMLEYLMYWLVSSMGLTDHFEFPMVRYELCQIPSLSEVHARNYMQVYAGNISVFHVCSLTIILRFPSDRHERGDS